VVSPRFRQQHRIGLDSSKYSASATDHGSRHLGTDVFLSFIILRSIGQQLFSIEDHSVMLFIAARSRTKSLVASICAALALSFAAINVQAEEQSSGDFLVQYDQARIMRIDEPATDIIVGNPSIADVAIQGAKLLVVTGKTFGVTNLIVLNGAGQVIVNRRLVVRADDQKIVGLTRGMAKSSYNCAPKCQSVLSIGDEPTYYDTISKASQTKLSISDKSIDGGQGGQ